MSKKENKAFAAVMQALSTLVNAIDQLQNTIAPGNIIPTGTPLSVQQLADLDRAEERYKSALRMARAMTKLIDTQRKP